jgi:hypothetical protein
MTVVFLAAKAALAVLLLVAGGAKLSDLDGFSTAVALFAPPRTPRRLLRAVAVALAGAELAAGAASLAAPSWRWVNLAVLVLSCGFVAVSALGYARHRDRTCRCFGALSRRRFDLGALLRAGVIAAVAALAAGPVSTSSVRLGLAGQLLLLGCAVLVAVAARTAARVLAAARESVLGWSS